MADFVNIIRHYTVLTPGQRFREKKLWVLDDFSSSHGLVILGSPGMGKTEVFKQAARTDSDGKYVTARNFPLLQQAGLVGKTLYIDALDEARPDKTEQDKIDRIVQRLCELGSPKFRISCREADWLGSIDLSVLSAVKEDEEQPLVLRLEPLTNDDVRLLLQAFGEANPDKFIEDATAKNLGYLLDNPATLNLLTETVQKNGGWPITKTDLLKKACDILIKEANGQHHLIGTKFDGEQLLEIAGHISAVMLFGGLDYVSMKQDSHEGLWIGKIGDNPEICFEVIRRRIFRVPEENKIIPIHRIVTEHLAASYLANKVIKKKLPCERVVALMLAQDDKPAIDLRGLFASFASIDPDNTGRLIESDPIGVVLYGDPASLPIAKKRKLLNAIISLSKADPYFRVVGVDDRSSYSARHLFGALGVSDLKNNLKTIIDDPTSTNHLVVTACDIIEFGSGLTELGPSLLKLVKNDKRSDWIRTAALRAYLAIFRGSHQKALRVLNDLNAGKIAEGDSRDLRGHLLKTLYPKFLTSHQLLASLVEDSQSHFGTYSLFVGHDLSELVPPDQLPILLDDLSNRKLYGPSNRKHTLADLHIRLLLKALQLKPIYLTGKKLYEWTVPFNEHSYTRMMNDDLKDIKKILEANSQLVLDAYKYGIENKTGIIMKNFMFSFQREQMLSLPVPDGLTPILFDVLSKQKGTTLGGNVFTAICRLSWDEKRIDAQSPTQLEAIATKDPVLKKLWDESLSPSAQKKQGAQYRKLEAQHRKIAEKHKKEHESNRKLFIEDCLKARKEIEAGTSNILCSLAKLYFGRERFYGLPDSATFNDSVGTVVENFALKGFVTALRSADLPTPTNIATAYSENKHYNGAYLVLAGMDIAYKVDKDSWKTLPDKTIKIAFLFHHTDLTGDYKGEDLKDTYRAWVIDIIKSKPKLAQDSLYLILHAQIAANSSYIPTLHDVAKLSFYKRVSKDIAVRLLNDFPRCKPSILMPLVQIFLEHESKSKCLAFVSSVLAAWPKSHDSELIIWLSAGMILNPDKYGPPLKKRIDKSTPESAWEAADFIRYTLNIGPCKKYLNVELNEKLIATFGAIFPPASMPTGVFSGSGHSWDRSRFIDGFIADLALRSDRDATNALIRLIDRKELAPWKNALMHHLATQIRRHADAAFERPKAEAVIEALKDGPPATPSDLQSLIAYNLANLQYELLNGDVDGWKDFWNLKGRHGNAESPRPEDNCRDQIISRLRLMLGGQSITLDTEARVRRNKRVDIKARCLHGKFLPLEVKCNSNKELWTAPRQQLFEKYMTDSSSCSRGIYLVIWFGNEFTKVKSLSPNIVNVTTPEALKSSLQAKIASEGLSGIQCFVLDVSKQS